MRLSTENRRQTLSAADECNRLRAQEISLSPIMGQSLEVNSAVARAAYYALRFRKAFPIAIHPQR
jgi:hypothetical protein